MTGPRVEIPDLLQPNGLPQLARRNNNPGNLRYVGQPGAVPGEGGFAKFETPEAGYEALRRQVQLDQSRGIDLRTFVTKYAPPVENDTDSYLARASARLRVAPDVRIDALDTDSIASFMASHESQSKIDFEPMRQAQQPVAQMVSAPTPTQQEPDDPYARIMQKFMQPAADFSDVESSSGSVSVADSVQDDDPYSSIATKYLGAAPEEPGILRRAYDYLLSPGKARERFREDQAILEAQARREGVTVEDLRAMEQMKGTARGVVGSLGALAAGTAESLEADERADPFRKNIQATPEDWKPSVGLSPSVADAIRRVRDRVRGAIGEPLTHTGERFELGARMATDLVPYVLPGVGMARYGTVVKDGVKIQRFTRGQMFGADVAAGVPVDVAFAASEPEESTLGTLEAIGVAPAGASESKEARVATEVLIGGLAAGTIEGLLRARQAARQASRSKASTAAVTPPASVVEPPPAEVSPVPTLGDPIPPDVSVPFRAPETGPAPVAPPSPSPAPTPEVEVPRAPEPEPARAPEPEAEQPAAAPGAPERLWRPGDQAEVELPMGRYDAEATRLLRELVAIENEIGVRPDEVWHAGTKGSADDLTPRGKELMAAREALTNQIRAKIGPFDGEDDWSMAVFRPKQEHLDLLAKGDAELQQLAEAYAKADRELQLVVGRNRSADTGTIRQAEEETALLEAREEAREALTERLVKDGFGRRNHEAGDMAAHLGFAARYQLWLRSGAVPPRAPEAPKPAPKKPDVQVPDEPMRVVQEKNIIGGEAAPPVAPTVAAREDVRTPGPTGRAPIKATSGNPDVITFGDGTKITARYRIVEAEDMQPSHDASSFNRNANYPAEVQGRAYHRDQAAQLHVIERAQRLDADQLVRDTGNAEGTPIITSDGIVVGGNGRTMMLQRAARQHPEAFAAYVQRVREKAALFGVDPNLVDGFRHPVLVREIDDLSVDSRRVEDLARLNDVTDMPASKARDAASEATVRARRLRESPETMAWLAEQSEAVNSLRELLSDPMRGPKLVGRLVADGVIAPQEHARFVTNGRLTEDAKTLIEDMLLAAAIGDADVYARARGGAQGIVNKLDSSVYHLLIANSSPGYELTATLRDALDLVLAVRGTGAKSLAEYFAQGALFGTPARNPMAEVLADVLMSDSKRGIAQMLRKYAKLAGEFVNAAQSNDMFGYAPLSAEDLFHSVFSGERKAIIEAAQRDLHMGGDLMDLAEPSPFSTMQAPVHPRAGSSVGAIVNSEPVDAQAFRGDLYGAFGGARTGDRFDHYAVVPLDEATFQRFGVGGRYGYESLTAFQAAYPGATHIGTIRRATDGLWMGAPIRPGTVDEMLAWGEGLQPMAPGQPFDALNVQTTPQSQQLPHARPYVQGTAQKAPNPVDIVRQLDQIMRKQRLRVATAATDIREGVPGSMKRAMGVAHRIGGWVGLRSIANLDVMAHELGHRFHALFFGLKPNGGFDLAPMKPFQGELVTLAAGVKGPKLSEGWAEYWRIWFDHPEVLPSVAPKLHSWAESQLATTMPEVHTFLLNARKEWRAYKESSAHARVASRVSWLPRRHLGIRDWLRRFNVNAFEEFAEIEQLEPIIRGTGRWTRRTADMVSTRIRLIHGAAGQAEGWLFHGSRDFHTGRINGKGLAQILKPVKDDEVGFSLYMLARRVQELNTRVKVPETGITLADAERIIADAQTKPHYAATFQELQDFNKRMRQYLVDGEVLTPEAAAVWEKTNANYTPLFREIDRKRGGGPHAGTEEMMRVKNPIKSLKGSGQDIVAPLESWVKNVHAYMSAVQRKRVEKAVLRLAQVENAGAWGLRIDVDPPKERVRVSGLRIVEWLDDQGVDITQLPDKTAGYVVDPEDLAQQVLDIYRVRRLTEHDPYVSFIDAKTGKRRWVEVDKEWWDVLSGGSDDEVNQLGGILAKFARTLRAGATLSLEFMLRNPTRDIPTAFVQDPRGITKGFTPIDFVRGLTSRVLRDEVWQEFLDSGAGRASLLAQDRKAMHNEVRKLIGRKKTLGEWVGTPIDLLRAFSDVMEDATRLGSFGKATGAYGIHDVTDLKNLGFGNVSRLRGISADEKALAGLQAREATVDFARHGARYAGVRAGAAFWNAQIQGYRQLFASFRRNPALFLSKAGMAITFPSLYLMGVNYDDESYWKVPQWQRDLFWLIPYGRDEATGDTKFMRWPKPFELGWLFGTLPEHAMAFARERDPYEFKRSMIEFGKNVGLGLVPIPTAAVVPLQAAINKTRFGRDIIPRQLEGLDPDMQVKGGTTEFARQTQKWLHLPVSPILIDHYLFGYTGGLGRTAAELSDVLTGKSDQLPAGRGIGFDRASEIPGIRGLVVPDYGESNAKFDRFYDLLGRARNARKTFNVAVRTDRYEGRFTPEREELAGMAPMLEQVNEQMGELRKLVADVRAQTDLTPEAKRVQIAELTRAMDALVSDVLPSPRRNRQ